MVSINIEMDAGLIAKTGRLRCRYPTVHVNLIGLRT